MPTRRLLFKTRVDYGKVLKWVTRSRSLEGELIAYAFGIWWISKPKQAVRWAQFYEGSVKPGKTGYTVRLYRRL